MHNVTCSVYAALIPGTNELTIEFVTRMMGSSLFVYSYCYSQVWTVDLKTFTNAKRFMMCLCC